jgi:outer membrane protein
MSARRLLSSAKSLAAKPLAPYSSLKWTLVQSNRENTSKWVRLLTAALLSGLLATGAGFPAFAQNPNASTQDQKPSSGAGPTSLPIPVSLGVSKNSYRHSPRPFPNLHAPFRPTPISEFGLSNSPRLEELIHDGKLEITLQEAVERALENSVDIAVARYSPWLADTDILAAEGGALPQGVGGSEIQFSTANVPFLSLDPVLTGSVGFDDRSTPINNPFTSGTGTASATGLISHEAQYNAVYTQGFSSGTTLTTTWDNARSSSNSAANFFNPSVQSSLQVSFSQQLLNGFGFAQNRRNIVIAKNNRELADYEFELQAITTVTNTINAYWELVFARENVKVQEQAVIVSNKLFADNKKQLEIGTIGQIEVTRAESEVATDRQNLIVAQTVQLTDEQLLKSLITRDPMARILANVEVIPLDRPNPPETVEPATFEDAVKQAFTKRPDLVVQQINVTNAGIDSRANRQALLPTATLTAQYLSSGLAGNSPIITGTSTIAGSQLVSANGQPVTVLDMSGVPLEVFEPITTAVANGTFHQGVGNAQSQIFHNRFPDYLAAINGQISIRNRQAQASYQHAVLSQRQIEAQMQQLRNYCYRVKMREVIANPIYLDRSPQGHKGR